MTTSEDLDTGAAAVRKRLFFFYGNFKPDMWWWDVCVIMPRKVLFGAIIVLMQKFDVKEQLYAGIWLIGLALLLQVWYRPFINPLHDRMECWSLGLLFAAMLCAIPLAYEDDGLEGEIPREVVESVIFVILTVMIMGLVLTFFKELTCTVSSFVAAARKAPALLQNASSRHTSSRHMSSRKLQDEAARAHADVFSSNNPMNTSSKRQKLSALDSSNTVSVHSKRDQQGAGHV